MLETIAGGLVVALVTGVTIIAYKHPHAYRKYFDPMSWIVLAVFCGRLIYSIAFGKGFNAAVSAVHDLNKTTILQTPPFPDDSFLALFYTDTSSLVSTVLVVPTLDSRFRER
jgi:hypothetical protein